METGVLVQTLIVALVLLPLAAGLVTWFLPGVRRTEYLAVGVSLLHLLLTILCVDLVLRGSKMDALLGALRVDGLSALLLVMISVVALGAFAYSVGYMRTEQEHRSLTDRRVRGYYTLMHGFVGTMCLVAVSDSLGLMWVGIEATTIASGMLVAFNRTPEALEAAWKYLILCTVGIALALFGTILTYFAAIRVMGEVPVALDWSALVTAAPSLDPYVMKLAFVFILVGYGTKAGLAPMHSWLPDAHSQAPAPASALLSGVLLACSVYAIARFNVIVSAAVGDAFTSGLLLTVGLFSVLVGALLILAQRDFKRLLAYSSVEHMGVITVGLAIGGKMATLGATLHMLTHALSKSLMFFAAGRIAQRYGTRDIERVRGVLTHMPVTAIAFFVGALAIGGSPPFGPFVSELAILAGAFGSGSLWVGAVVAVLIVVAFAGLLGVLGRMLFGEGDAEHPFLSVVSRQAWTRGLWTKSVLVAGVAAIVVVGPVLPGGIAELVESAAKVVMNDG